MRHTPYSTNATEPNSAPFGGRWWWAPDLGVATLRIVVGLLLAWQGGRTLFGLFLPPGARWAGAPLPWTEPWIDAVVLIGGGALLVVGLFTRATAALLVVQVALAHLVSSGALAWNWTGAELAAVYCVVLLTLAMTGPGLFSVEWLVQSQVSWRRRRNTVSLSPWIRRQYRRRELAR